MKTMKSAVSLVLILYLCVSLSGVSVGVGRLREDYAERDG